MTEERHFQLYFEVLQRYYTPAEFEAILRLMGTVEEVRVRRAEQGALAAQAEQKKAIWSFIRTVLLSLSSVLAALAIIKGLLPTGWQPW